MGSRKVLVIVPFPMSEENRLQRAAQLDAVEMGPGIEFHFRPVRAGPASYTSDHDSVLADLSILDAGKRAQEEGYDAILIMWDRWRHLYKKPILELGLTWRCASIRSIGVEPSNQSLLAGKEDEVFPLLLEAARRCIDEDGADVILLGSTTMHQAHAYLRDRLPVPVINPGPLSYKLAEAALALRLGHSRKAHAKPAVPRLDMVDAMMAAAAAQRARE